MKYNFCIGIIGGMGALAGVELQRRIVEATPAINDQDHLPVLCFTNPHIPDRTQSIIEGTKKGEALSALYESIETLERAGATVLAIPCNTAHAYLHDLQSHAQVPIVDMVQRTVESITKTYGADKPVRMGLLATTGTFHSRVYESRSQGKIEWIIPQETEQTTLMEIIYDTKIRGVTTSSTYKLQMLINALQERIEVDGVVLGCTELSLYRMELKHEIVLVDPLSIFAHHLVTMRDDLSPVS